MRKAVILAGLTAALAIAAPALAADPQAHYEAVAVEGTPSYASSFFRINIATGQTVSVGAGPQFVAVVDSAPIPPGDYHLVKTQSLTPDNKVFWTLTRIDLASGRTWLALGGGAAPLAWTEVAPPK